MSSKTAPARIHVAMLNSLRAIEMLGGGKLKVSAIRGKFSRNVATVRATEGMLHRYYQRLGEMYSIRWKADGGANWLTVSQILRQLEEQGCPDVFIESITIELPWVKYSEHTLENQETWVPFVFHPHPFKPSVWNRLKGRMPSFVLYARIKEIRKILGADLDNETRKRWRDVLLINYPHESLSNQEIRQIWAKEPCCILLKESKGKFTLMEVAESRA